MGNNMGKRNISKSWKMASAPISGKGIPRVDPLDFFNEWMCRSGNRANPKLIMQFCQKCGDAFNWYTKSFTQEQLNNIRVEY
jgi:hypothetical protein